MKSRRGLAIGLAAAAVLTVGGCSTDGPAGNRGDGGARTLGIVQFSGDDVYSNSALNGAAKYAESQGWKTITVDAKGSVDGANAAMENLITRGVDALLVSVFPSSALSSGAASAAEAQIPVANWGGGLGNGVKFAADTALGDEIARRVVEDMMGHGDLLALGYRPGLPCQNREAALDKVLAGTEVKVTKQQITIPGAATSASEATLGWLASHQPQGQPIAVWACFDDPATGVASALRQAGRNDVLSYGLNGTAPALELVRKGELTATLWIDGPAQGQDLAKLLMQHLKDPTSVKSQVIGGTTKVIDRSNVESFLAEHPELR
ncbi:sugar ABC transporter substrate-binding protein [Micromonospora fulviviridis]|uniref:Sugar ABC transporter substrate-binding protein n=2 Tax=Micromonospora fulviviridis TaxID=47860 RepID=A0ABV2VV29_9ACTN